jgi:hypothetical protein
MCVVYVKGYVCVCRVLYLVCPFISYSLTMCAWLIVSEVWCMWVWYKLGLVFLVDCQWSGVSRSVISPKPLGPGASIIWRRGGLMCPPLGPLGRPCCQSWGRIINPFDNQTVSLPWLSRISDTSENKPDGFDSNNQINISRLISFLVSRGSTFWYIRFHFEYFQSLVTSVITYNNRIIPRFDVVYFCFNPPHDDEGDEIYITFWNNVWKEKKTHST